MRVNHSQSSTAQAIIVFLSAIALGLIAGLAFGDTPAPTTDPPQIYLSFPGDPSPNLKAAMDNAVPAIKRAYVVNNIDPDGDDVPNWSGIEKQLKSVPKSSPTAIDWEPVAACMPGKPFNSIVGAHVSLAKRTNEAAPKIPWGWYGKPKARNESLCSELLQDRLLAGMQHEFIRHAPILTQSIYMIPPNPADGLIPFSYLDNILDTTHSVDDGKDVYLLVRTRYEDLRLIDSADQVAWIQYAIKHAHDIGMNVKGVWGWTDGETDFRRYSTIVGGGDGPGGIYAAARREWGDRYKLPNGKINLDLIAKDVESEQLQLLGDIRRALAPSPYLVDRVPGPPNPADSFVSSVHLTEIGTGNSLLIKPQAATSPSGGSGQPSGNASPAKGTALASSGGGLSQVVDVDVLMGVLNAWGVSNGGADVDDLFTVINAWGNPCIRPSKSGHTTNALVYLSDGDTLKDKIVFCPDDAITKGVEVQPGATVKIENVTVIGSWQALTFGSGSNVTTTRVRAINCRSQPGGGGYGVWSDGKTWVGSYCLFACGPSSWQYAARTTGTTVTLVNTTFIGAPNKFFTSRMTQSQPGTLNLLVDCTWIGTEVSFGGGEAGPGIGNFPGEIRNPTFTLAGNTHVKAQPGVNGLAFTGTITASKPDWLYVDPAASNVTFPGTAVLAEVPIP